jgi:hypothetical protein
MQNLGSSWFVSFEDFAQTSLDASTDGDFKTLFDKYRISSLPTTAHWTRYAPVKKPRKLPVQIK